MILSIKSVSYSLILILSLLVPSVYTIPAAASIKSFGELSEYCLSFSQKLEIDNIKSHEFLKIQNYYKVCEAYITGYLDVANHNCKHDLYTDRLHKLDTISISFKQIIKAIEIYAQMLSKKTDGKTIDHIWRALNPHWPCKN